MRTNKVTSKVRMAINIENGPPALDAARQRLYIPTPRTAAASSCWTRERTRQGEITVGVAPDGPVLDADRRLLYVPEFDEGDGRSVYVVDTTTNTLVTTITVPRGPSFPVLGRASGRLYVPSFVTGILSVIDQPALP